MPCRPAGDLAAALVVERARCSSSMIASARRRRSCACGVVALAHRARGLEQEAAGAVVEHHDELPGRRGEDALLLVGGGLECRCTWATRAPGESEGTGRIAPVVGAAARGLRRSVAEASDASWPVSQACWVCESAAPSPWPRTGPSGASPRRGGARSVGSGAVSRLSSRRRDVRPHVDHPGRADLASRRGLDRAGEALTCR